MKKMKHAKAKNQPQKWVIWNIMAYVLLALLTCRNIHASTDFKGSKLVAKLNKCI